MKTLLTAVTLAAITATGAMALESSAISDFARAMMIAEAQAVVDAKDASDGIRHSASWTEYQDLKELFKDDWFLVAGNEPMILDGERVTMRQIAAGNF